MKNPIRQRHEKARHEKAKRERKLIGGLAEALPDALRFP